MRFFLVLVFFCLKLLSSDVQIASFGVVVVNKDIKLEEVKKMRFDYEKKDYFNFGFKPDLKVWLKLDVKNNKNKNIEKLLVINNPLLEKVFFFDEDKVFKSGMYYIDKNREFIYPSYKLHLKKFETKTLYVLMENKHTSLKFGFNLYDEDEFKKEERTKQFMIVFLFGVLSAFLLYSLILNIYTKDIGYYLYALYLSTLIFQQMTYVGFLPLFVPSWFVEFYSALFVPKLSIMMISAIFFAKKFLKTDKFILLDKIYSVYLWILVLHMPLVGTEFFYLPEITLMLGTLLVFVNIFGGIYVYLKGHRQARFFVIGWSFLLVGYLLMIFGGLGFTNIMSKFPELVLLLAVFEALFLMLAFSDRLNMLTKQKNELDKKLLNEMRNRHNIVEKKVIERTNDLQMALEEKDMLYKELHHRVKNNLQLILSIIRLQRFSRLDERSKDEFKKLENRIKAISKTHEILCESDGISKVDMQEYILELCSELKQSIAGKNITFSVCIEAIMPLKEAVYIGLIINELVSNSIKYAFEGDNGEIYIELQNHHNRFKLIISDSGKGYKKESIKESSLGLKLVESLVKRQLKGKISNKIEEDIFKYEIEF